MGAFVLWEQDSEADTKFRTILEGEPSLFDTLSPIWASIFCSAPLLEVGTWLSFLLIILLLFCSALLSGSEVAYFSITHHEITELNETPDAKSDRIMRLLKKPRYLLSTILISNNFINIGIIVLSNFLINEQFQLEAQLPSWLAFTISTIAVTFLLVLFGEVAPKVYASTNNMRLAGMMGQPLLLLRRLFWPISYVLVNSTLLIEGRLERHRGGSGGFNNEDINRAIELTVRRTTTNERDVDMLKRIVRFGNISAKQIMRSRVDIEAIDKTISFHQVLEAFTSSNYSRIPVYDENLDTIEGIVHSKDMLEYMEREADYDWHHLIRPVHFAPENKHIDKIFGDFKDKRLHMAIIVNEYGETLGLLTLEDILEEIVGEIKDEFDGAEQKPYVLTAENTYEFEAKVSLHDMCIALGVNPETFDDVKGESESLAGLLLEREGRILQEGEQVPCKDFSFKVLKASNRSIERVEVRPPERKRPEGLRADHRSDGTI